MPQPVCGSGASGSRSEPAGKRVLAQQKAQRRADGGVGEAGQRLGRRDDVPDAADVGERDEQRRFALGEPQRAHQLAPRRRRAGRRAPRRSRRANSPGGAGEQTQKPGRVFRDEAPEIGRMIGEAEEEIADLVMRQRGPEAGRLRRLRSARRAGGAPAAGAARRGAVDEAFSQRCAHPRSRSPAPATAAARGSAGRVTRTRSPGSLSSSSTEPPCMRATAAASERPSPEPGREREPSSRTKRPRTRARSAGAMPGPRSATVSTTDVAGAARGDDDVRFHVGEAAFFRRAVFERVVDEIGDASGRSVRGFPDRQFALRS